MNSLKYSRLEVIVRQASETSVYSFNYPFINRNVPVITVWPNKRRIHMCVLTLIS